MIAYGITRPSRENLFTVASPEEKYSAKIVIDMVVQRVGDATAAALFQGIQVCVASCTLTAKCLLTRDVPDHPVHMCTEWMTTASRHIRRGCNAQVHSHRATYIDTRKCHLVIGSVIC